MNELYDLAEALWNVGTAPWSPYVMLGLAALHYAYTQRAAISGAIHRIYCTACEKSKGKLPSLNLTTILVVVAAGLLLWQRFGVPSVPGPDVPPPVVTPNVTATAATYVYEKDDTAPPTAIMAALNRLNRERKILATTFEDDTTDGGGDTPEQYKVPLKAAQDAGLPALVVTNGVTVVRVVKSPTTEQQVMEAAQ